MPVETAKVIHQLDDSNPRATDPKSQGDDHVRLLKAVLQTSFNGYEGVVALYGTDEGVANAYVVNPEIPVPLYGLGMIVSFEALEANTGPATLNVSDLGALPIVHTTGQPLEAGDIRPGVLTILQYDGTSFQAIGGSPHLSRVGDQKLTGDFAITGAVTIGGDVVTGGNLDIDGDFAMPGSATIGGDVDAEGGADFGGDGNFGGNITALGVGTNDLSAGRLLVKDVEPGSSDSNDAASIRYVNQTSLAASLPAQADNAGKYLRTNGSAAFWDLAGAIVRRLVTGATTLANADQTKLIDCTGTFTLSFAPAATLGDGWNCYVRNSGTGDITLDPNGLQTIDGLTSYIMYPGEVRLVQCDGVSLRTIVLNSFHKVFTASGNFIKPPGYHAYEGLLWAGGGASQTNGGGGGGCAPFRLNPASLPTTSSVLIGSGGIGSAGGESFFADITVRGGSQGGGSGGSGGAGGASGGVPGGNAASRNSIYGGGAGGDSSVTAGGNSIYGGGGGSHSSLSSIGGSSVLGGAGGSQGIAAQAPGGGGGGGTSPGARGEMRIWGGI